MIFMFLSSCQGPGSGKNSEHSTDHFVEKNEMLEKLGYKAYLNK